MKQATKKSQKKPKSKKGACLYVVEMYSLQTHQWVSSVWVALDRAIAKLRLDELQKELVSCSKSADEIIDCSGLAGLARELSKVQLRIKKYVRL